MIAQVLNRRFVIEQLQELAAQLKEDIKNGELPQAEEVSTEDYEQTISLVEKTLSSEQVTSSGQHGFDARGSERRGETVAPIDDFSFFSRDAVINNCQSALDQYFEDQAGSEEERVAEAELPDDRRRGSDDDVAVTDRTLPGAAVSRDLDGRRVFDKFSITDAGWVNSKIAEGIRLLRHKHAFNENPPEPIRIDDRARLILIGDWGSGLPRAQKVARQMRRHVEEAKRENREVHVVHLGDVYYSGWKREYERRFLPYWPVRLDEAHSVGSWCLNANHDMYSGGHAYFDYLLAEPRFKRQGKSSYFNLFNKDWEIAGLDTGWDDGGLKDPQATLLKSRLDQSTRKALLLSHHQLFSAYEEVGDEIRNKLQPVLDTNRVHAWFWGHEHRCLLYKPHLKVEYARCIGHGGVPVYMFHSEDDPYPDPGEYEYREYIDTGLEHWTIFGFAVLDLEGPRIHVSYVDESGYAHKEENIG